MFNNLFVFFALKTIDFCLFMLSIIVCRKKIGIGQNQYRQVTQKNRNWPIKLQSVHL